jgi:hypothetical protein
MIPMVDCTHANVGKLVPYASTIPKIAGYVTGTPDVIWTEDDWAAFPGSARVRIWQGYGAQLTPDKFDVLDVELDALTPEAVPVIVQERIAAGIEWTTVYGSLDTFPQVETALASTGKRGWFYGHVDCFVAAPLLSETAAIAMLGTLVSGMTCRAVQWAWPRYNPATIIPGTNLTLADAQADLSVTQDDWHARPAPVLVKAVTTGYYSDGTTKTVSIP